MFRVLENISGKPGPVRGLEFSIVATMPQATPAAYLLGIDGKLSFADRLICERVVFKDGPWFHRDAALLREGQEYTIQFFAPLTPEVILFIEDKCRGVEDLQFSLELLVKAQEVEVKPVPGARPKLDFGPVHWTRPGPNWTPVSFNRWNACLTGMDWLSWELVQLPKAVLESHPRTKSALGYFERARSNYTKGDWPEVLRSCYKCFEQLADDGEPGDKKARFARFLAEAFPDEKDADKRAKVDALIFAFSSLCQFGRHAGPSELRTGKADAEIALNLTASLLSLLGRALKDASDLAALETT